VKLQALVCCILGSKDMPYRNIEICLHYWLFSKHLFPSLRLCSPDSWGLQLQGSGLLLCREKLYASQLASPADEPLFMKTLVKEIITKKLMSTLWQVTCTVHTWNGLEWNYKLGVKANCPNALQRWVSIVLHFSLHKKRYPWLDLHVVHMHG
jgi:hypothetical protein